MPHRDLLAALLPPVSYDSNAPGVDLSINMEGRELDRIQADGQKVLGALQPWIWQQWLTDWERVYGLPGECYRDGQLLQERLALLALAFLERGGISLDWIKHYAALGGYDITITEYQPFRAGISKAGDPLTNGYWLYAFDVLAVGDITRVFRAGQSVAGEALRTWGDPMLECIINKYKPAHTVALVSYQNNEVQ
jgi:uncharacterized protein YmfQ (DUF2313 family)